MRIIVTQKCKEVLRDDVHKAESSDYDRTPDLTLLKAKISNFKRSLMYNRSVVEKGKVMQMNKSISIREVDTDIFNSPYFKKENKKKINYSPPRKQIINNLKTLAESIKISESNDVSKIVKKESVSPIFMKKLGIFNQDKINLIRKIENTNFGNLVCNYKYIK